MQLSHLFEHVISRRRNPLEIGFVVMFAPSAIHRVGAVVW